jgi:hypothetical protein
MESEAARPQNSEHDGGDCRGSRGLRQSIIYAQLELPLALSTVTSKKEMLTLFQSREYRSGRSGQRGLIINSCRFRSLRCMRVTRKQRYDVQPLIVLFQFLVEDLRSSLVHLVEF